LIDKQHDCAAARQSLSRTYQASTAVKQVLQLQRANHELVNRLHSDAQDRITKLQESAEVVLMHDAAQLDCARDGREQVQQLLGQVEESTTAEANSRKYNTQMKKSLVILDKALGESKTELEAMQQASIWFDHCRLRVTFVFICASFSMMSR
jgi:hypothetical protein